MEDKSGLYIVAIVGVVAVVALVVLLAGGNRATVAAPASVAGDTAGQAMIMTPCEKQCGSYDAVLSQDPCICKNPVA